MVERKLEEGKRQRERRKRETKIEERGRTTNRKMRERKIEGREEGDV